MNTDAASYITLPTPVGIGAEAYRLGRLVHEHSLRPGSHRTPAAEQGNDVLSHAKGKYGEIAFYEWLKSQGIDPEHTPFRVDYTKKVDDDDFIIGGRRVEIKTKMRKVSSQFPPKLHYNVNLGKKTIEDVIHIFIEVSGKKSLVNDPDAIIVGWAPPELIAERGQETWPGKWSDNGDFTFKRFDWDLAIRELLNPSLLLKALHH